MVYLREYDMGLLCKALLAGKQNVFIYVHRECTCKQIAEDNCFIVFVKRAFFSLIHIYALFSLSSCQGKTKKSVRHSITWEGILE